MLLLTFPPFIAPRAARLQQLGELQQAVRDARPRVRVVHFVVSIRARPVKGARRRSRNQLT
ncbi:MAG: hypothetical protein M9915_04650 [Rhizobacter sp.]|nr:hypothetical protein [Rhizobacter sp.]